MRRAVADYLKMQTHETPLTRRDNKFLNLLEQYWLLHGQIPTTEQVVEMDLTADYYHACMTNKLFRQKLAALGLGVEDPDDPKLVSWQLNERQLAAANQMLDLLDNRARKRKLSELGIQTQEWAAWMVDPVFLEYLRARSEKMISSHMHEAHLALLDRVRAGDLAAVKLYYELTGRYNPMVQRTGVDPLQLVHNLLEVIQKHVTDKKILERIGMELTVGDSVLDGSSSSHSQEIVEGELVLAGDSNA